LTSFHIDLLSLDLLPEKRPWRMAGELPTR
jgi:hypothetical protein